jgi:hypothetical protein
MGWKGSYETKEVKCSTCKQRFPSSNLIHVGCYYSYCLRCYRKTLQNYERASRFNDVTLRIYNHLPYVAAILGLIYLFFFPTSHEAFDVYLILCVVLSNLAIVGLLSLHPLSRDVLLKLRLKIQKKLGNYNPYTVETCARHPHIEAFGRCCYCFEPFCDEDFLVLVDERFCCFRCAPIHLERLRRT